MAKAAQTLTLSMVVAVDVGYLTREVAANSQGPHAPARVDNMRPQNESESAVEQDQARSTGTTWAARYQVTNIESMPLAESVRRGLVKVSNDVIVSAVNAVAAATPLDDHRHATTSRSPAQGRANIDEQRAPSVGRREGPRR